MNYIHILLILCSLVCMMRAEAEDSTAAKTTSEEKNSNDYFYDDGLNKEQIEQLQKEKKEKELLENEKQKEEKVDDPVWFKEDNKPKEDPLKKLMESFKSALDSNKNSENDTNSDPNSKYIKDFIKDYLKKYEKEQIEKFRSKNKSNSDVNHPMLSIITLSAFFSSGIVIGLIIVFVRGQHFKRLKRNSTNLKKKNIYKEVQQTDVDKVVVA